MAIVQKTGNKKKENGKSTVITRLPKAEKLKIPKQFKNDSYSNSVCQSLLRLRRFLQPSLPHGVG